MISLYHLVPNFELYKADHYTTLFEPTVSVLEKEGKGYSCFVGAESGYIPYTIYSTKKILKLFKASKMLSIKL